jgi:hypothetical protein
MREFASLVAVLFIITVMLMSFPNWDQMVSQ